MKRVSEKVQCVKIDKYYFRNHKGGIRKYLQFCRRKLCKAESSHNYRLIKLNALHQNENTLLKNINQLQNT